MTDAYTLEWDDWRFRVRQELMFQLDLVEVPLHKWHADQAELYLDLSRRHPFLSRPFLARAGKSIKHAFLSGLYSQSDRTKTVPSQHAKDRRMAIITGLTA